MSDYTPERRRSNADISDRLERLETIVERMEPRLKELGDRSHQTMTTLQSLVTQGEAAEDQHREQLRRITELAAAVSAATVASTRAEATLGATLAAHIEQCKTDKSAIQTTLLGQDAHRQALHEQNQKRFGDIQRIIWIAIGGGMVAWTFLTLLAPHVIKSLGGG